jgi:hypothetical protein
VFCFVYIGGKTFFLNEVKPKGVLMGRKVLSDDLFVLYESERLARQRQGMIKKRLLFERGAECEYCRRDSWEGGPVPLDLHHVDEDCCNNCRSNLRLLCCNCHALQHRF